MFNNTEEFGQYLQNLIDRHRKDLSILLSKHGYNDEPTPALLVLLYKQYGSEFVQELAKLKLSDDDLLHAEGSGLFAKIGNIFSKGAEVVDKVQTVAGKIAGNKSTASEPAAAPPKDDEPKDNKTKKIIIIGAIVIVVLIVTFIIVKKRKK